MKKPNNPILNAAREVKLSFTFSALVFLALGLVLLFMPGTSQKVLCTVVGVGLVVYGLFSILSFVLERDSVYTLELFIGICATAFGIFSLVDPTFLMRFLFIVLGIVVMVGSVCGIRRALNLRMFGFPQWWAALASACVTLLLALSIVFFPGLYGNMLTMFIGIVLIVESASDLFAIHRLSKFVKNS